jgi:hypothetical protein
MDINLIQILSLMSIYDKYILFLAMVILKFGTKKMMKYTMNKSSLQKWDAVITTLAFKI